eukprot:Phypoly_transcript_00427.p1 GENE.Phypoly_transcript_00427~~Phypoly_transcript_00427.p1  ORF type:complete len:1136 (+),score=110.82 Phypoly_transcript_00427:1413-4820(+)
MKLYAKSPIKNCIVARGVCCNLRGKNTDVIFAKENVVEALEHSQGTLTSFYEHPIFGTIRDMKKLTITNHDEPRDDYANTPKRDILVFLSDSGNLSFVGWEPSLQRLVSLSNVRIAAHGFIPKYLGNSVCVSPCQRILIVAALQDVISVFLVLPNMQTSAPGVLVSSPFSFKLGGAIWGVEFIYSGEESPDVIQFVSLCRMMGNAVCVMDFSLVTRETRLIYLTVVGNAIKIIPIPHFPHHFLVVQEDMELTLMDTRSTWGKITRKLSTDPELPSEWCWVGKFLLVGTDKGSIYQVCIEPPDTEPSEDMDDTERRDITFEFKKIYSGTPVSTMVSLPGSYVALPGEMGDGIVAFARETTSKLGVHPLLELDLKHELSNWAPILDFQVADYYGEGQDQIFAISGGGDTSSLRIIRNGLAVNVVTSTPRDFPINGMWVVDKYVVLAFVNSTGVYITNQKEFSDYSLESGLNLETTTIFADYILGKYILQTTTDYIQLCKPSPSPNIPPSQAAKFTLAEGSVISCAKSRNEIIVLGISKPNRILVLCVNSSSQNECEVATLFQIEQEAECACLELPLMETCSTNFPDAMKSILLVATHKPSLDVYELSPPPHGTCQKRTSFPLNSNEIPSAISCNNLGTNQIHVILGTREGAVLRWELNTSGPDMLQNLSTRRLGILPVQLIPERDFGVLVLTNHPWLLSNTRNRPYFSSISFPTISHAARLSSPTLPHSFLFVSEQSLHYVTLPSSRKLNVTKFDLHEVPQRIIYLQSTKYLAVATRKKRSPNEMETDEFNHLKLIDPMDGITLSTKSLTAHGRVLCMQVCLVNGVEHLLVGTGHDLPDTSTSGTLHLFFVETQPETPPVLRQVWKKDFGAYVQSIATYLQYLIIGTGDTVALFQLFEDFELMKLSFIKTRSPVTSISVGAARVALGSTRDGLMFYHFKNEYDDISLQFKFGDSRSRTMADCVMLNDDTAFGIDRYGNVHVLLYDDIERFYGQSSLEAECNFSLREISRRIRPTSSLVYQAEETARKGKLVICPTMLGSIYVFAPISDSRIYEELSALSHTMASHPLTCPLLGNSHLGYRSEVQETKNVIDGDLIGQFAELDATTQESICNLVKWPNTPLTPLQICRIIESIDQTIL